MNHITRDNFNFDLDQFDLRVHGSSLLFTLDCVNHRSPRATGMPPTVGLGLKLRRSGVQNTGDIQSLGLGVLVSGI
jgi:hypothetical protein